MRLTGSGRGTSSLLKGRLLAIWGSEFLSRPSHQTCILTDRLLFNGEKLCDLALAVVLAHPHMVSEIIPRTEIYLTVNYTKFSTDLGTNYIDTHHQKQNHDTGTFPSNHLY